MLKLSNTTKSFCERNYSCLGWLSKAEPVAAIAAMRGPRRAEQPDALVAANVSERRPVSPEGKSGRLSGGAVKAETAQKLLQHKDQIESAGIPAWG